MNFLNTHSALILFIIALALGAVATARLGGKPWAWGGLVGVGLLGVLTWLVMRPMQTENVSSSLEGVLAQGKPVLLEFQSPY